MKRVDTPHFRVGSFQVRRDSAPKCGTSPQRSLDTSKARSKPAIYPLHSLMLRSTRQLTVTAVSLLLFSSIAPGQHSVLSPAAPGNP